jgi:hypothetical protein
MLIRERRYIEKERKPPGSVKLSFKSQSYRLLDHHLRGDNQRLPEASLEVMNAGKNLSFIGRPIRGLSS